MIVTFQCDDHYRPLNAMLVHNLCTLSGCLGGGGGKNDKVRHYMTLIASLLAVATIFICLWTLFYS